MAIFKKKTCAVIIFFVTSIVSIGASPVHEVATIHSILQSRNLASEEHIIDSGSLKRYVRQFGEDAFFYVALILLEENQEDVGLYLLEEQTRTGPSWIREAAVLELIRFYQKKRTYKEVIELSRVFNNKFPSSPFNEEVRWQRNEALYWSEEYSEVFNWVRLGETRSTRSKVFSWVRLKTSEWVDQGSYY